MQGLVISGGELISDFSIMKQILIINVNITGNSPQPIRIRNLVNHWQKSAKITIVAMNNFGDEILFPGENVKVIKTPYSRIGKVMISKNIIASKEYLEAKKTLKRKIREFVRKIWRTSIFYKLVFPDKFIFEHSKIIKSVKNLKRSGNLYDTIIISAAPFSLLKLGKTIKKLFPGAVCIYDTGDPFYGNTTLLLIKPLRTYFAHSFENKYLPYFDKLVVPTDVLKEHYLHHFNKALASTEVKVVEQGIEDIFSTVLQKNNFNPGELKLVYAGGLYKNLREPFELYKAIRDYKSSRIGLRIFGNIYKDMLPEAGERFYYGGSIGPVELVEEYEACDITVFIDNLSGVQIPGKILELLSIKRPVLFILGNPGSPTLPFVKDEKRVVICENNSASIIKSLDLIKDHYRSFVYSDLSSRYLWSSLADKYLEN
jgi:hypothetical protein